MHGRSQVLYQPGHALEPYDGEEARAGARAQKSLRRRDAGGDCDNGGRTPERLYEQASKIQRREYDGIVEARQGVSGTGKRSSFARPERKCAQSAGHYAGKDTPAHRLTSDLRRALSTFLNSKAIVPLI